MRPVYTVDLSPRENTHDRPGSAWWILIQVAALGGLIYIILVLVMVG